MGAPSQPLTLPRKPLNFQNLPEHLDQLLHVDEEEEEESQGRWQHKSGRGFKGWGARCPFCVCLSLCLAQPLTLVSALQNRLKGGLARPLWSSTTQVALKGCFWWMMTSWG